MIDLYVHNVPAGTYAQLDVEERYADELCWKTYKLPGLKLLLFPAPVSSAIRVVRSDPPQERHQDAQLCDVERVVEGATVDSSLRQVVDNGSEQLVLDVHAATLELLVSLAAFINREKGSNAPPWQ